MTGQSKHDQMSEARALVERLRKAEGSEILPTVLLGMHNAETTCLHAADALTAALDEIERLRDAIEYYEIGVCAVAVPHDGERKVLHDSVKAAREALKGANH